ncbi:hypothetical protein LIER_12861 [Lithospermum erythrorhizon]|uniref:Uncharacterized protein n=1 Tax=Lithospermum erythrorhizon TaxID=34254 RepID=A0AAV3PVF9_LITER
MLVDTRSTVDILFLDAYHKLGMSRAQIRPEATPLVGFTRDTVNPLGVDISWPPWENTPSRPQRWLNLLSWTWKKEPTIG